MTFNFDGNNERTPPLPNVNGSVLLFSGETGELKAILGGAEITSWRTPAASIVSTDHLFFKRSEEEEGNPSAKALAVVGCGIQGRYHAIGFCTLKSFAVVYLWNRTKGKASDLLEELNDLRFQFKNRDVRIEICDSVEDCVKHADVIVTATFTATPLFNRAMIKDNVHINGMRILSLC